MKMQLKKKELKLDVYGDIFNIEFPTAKRMFGFQSDIMKIIKGESKKSDYELASELLVELGLGKEVVESIYSDDMKDIIKVLDGQKKI